MMSDDQLARENAARDLVKVAACVIRDSLKPLYHAAFQSDLESESLTRLAEAIEAALSDFQPNDAAWAEKIQTARNS